MIFKLLLLYWFVIRGFGDEALRGVFKGSDLPPYTARRQRHPLFQLGLLPALQTLRAHFHHLEVAESFSRALSNC